MSIVLPEPQEETARQRAAELGLTPEDYLAHVVQMEASEARWATLTPEEQAAQVETERLLDEALESGPPIPADKAYFEELKRRAQEIASREPWSDFPTGRPRIGWLGQNAPVFLGQQPGASRTPPQPPSQTVCNPSRL